MFRCLLKSAEAASRVSAIRRGNQPIILIIARVFTTDNHLISDAAISEAYRHRCQRRDLPIDGQDCTGAPLTNYIPNPRRGARRRGNSVCEQRPHVSISNYVRTIGSGLIDMFRDLIDFPQPVIVVERERNYS